MRVSQRLDYTLALLVALAQLPPGEFAGSGALAERLGLPRRFLELQTATLTSAGLIHCRRGARGGCTLARDPASVSVADVVRAVDGAVLDVPRTRHSATAEAWNTAADSLERELGAVTLAHLATRQRALDAERAPMYFI